MKIAVIGLGRFGQSLALNLAERGAEVIAIDKDREAVDTVKDKVARAVILDSEDANALKEQGMDKVDAAVVSVTLVEMEPVFGGAHGAGLRLLRPFVR